MRLFEVVFLDTSLISLFSWTSIKCRFWQQWNRYVNLYHSRRTQLININRRYLGINVAYFYPFVCGVLRSFNFDSFNVVWYMDIQYDSKFYMNDRSTSRKILWYLLHISDKVLLILYIQKKIFVLATPEINVAKNLLLIKRNIQGFHTQHSSIINYKKIQRLKLL